jgi:hypothetical protein
MGARREVVSAVAQRYGSAKRAEILGNMRANGVRSLAVWRCHHKAVLSADRWPDLRALCRVRTSEIGDDADRAVARSHPQHGPRPTVVPAPIKNRLLRRDRRGEATLQS